MKHLTMIATLLLLAVTGPACSDGQGTSDPPTDSGELDAGSDNYDEMEASEDPTSDPDPELEADLEQPDGGDLSDLQDDEVPEECTEETMWWIWDLSVMPPTDTQICAFVRGVGENVVVVVEDEAWEGAVDQTDVEWLIEAWDVATPSTPEAGIFETVTGLFGEPPDEFDSDPRVYLLLYEMEGFGGYTFDGYFKVDDQTAGAHSNRRELLHINVAEQPPATDYMLSVQAHEFQHMIHWGADADEESWLNEAMSELAMVITGFGMDEAWVASWLADPSDTLMADSRTVNYGLLLLFGTYLWEQFGDAFITDLVADPSNGRTSVEAAMGTAGSGLSFEELLADFALAIAVDDPEVMDGELGFDTIDFPSVHARELELAVPLDLSVAARGGFAFLRSIGEGGTLTIDAVETDVSLRVALLTADGFEMLGTELTGESTPFTVGEGTLWVVMANAGASSRDLTVTLDR